MYVRDVTRQRLRDPRTGLPNRIFLFERLRQLIDRDLRQGAPYALLLVRVDRFDDVVNGLGEGASDGLVRQLGERLSRVANVGATLTQLESDLFAALVEEVPSNDVLTGLADRLRASMFGAFRVGDSKVHLTVSVGISPSDDQRTTPESMLAAARAALHTAKDLWHSKQVLADSAFIHTMSGPLSRDSIPRSVLAGEPGPSQGSAGLVGAGCLYRPIVIAGIGST